LVEISRRHSEKRLVASASLALSREQSGMPLTVCRLKIHCAPGPYVPPACFGEGLALRRLFRSSKLRYECLGLFVQTARAQMSPTARSNDRSNDGHERVI
jgi:hypothetical protein